MAHDRLGSGRRSRVRPMLGDLRGRRVRLRRPLLRAGLLLPELRQTRARHQARRRASRRQAASVRGLRAQVRVGPRSWASRGARRFDRPPPAPPATPTPPPRLLRRLPPRATQPGEARPARRAAQVRGLPEKLRPDPGRPALPLGGLQAARVPPTNSRALAAARKYVYHASPGPLHNANDGRPRHPARSVSRQSRCHPSPTP